MLIRRRARKLGQTMASLLGDQPVSNHIGMGAIGITIHPPITIVEDSSDISKLGNLFGIRVDTIEYILIGLMPCKDVLVPKQDAVISSE